MQAAHRHRTCRHTTDTGLRLRCAGTPQAQDLEFAVQAHHRHRTYNSLCRHTTGTGRRARCADRPQAQDAEVDHRHTTQSSLCRQNTDTPQAQDAEVDHRHRTPSGVLHAASLSKPDCVDIFNASSVKAR